MLPLVIGCALVVAAAAPVASHVQRRRALLRAARDDAERVAVVLRGEIDQHPRLWRYDGVKLAERLAEEGLLQVPALVLRDDRGAEVEVAWPRAAQPRREADLLWGAARVSVDGAILATVWVGQEVRPLWRETAWLAAGFAALAAVLGAVLYLLPMRVIRAAEGRIRGLMGRLLLTLQEEDRRRIARELHDGVGQALTAARLQILALSRTTEPNREARLRGVLEHLDQAIEEVRRATRQLSVPALGELGLAGALRRLCETFAAASGLEVDCDVDLDLRLPSALETACYRIAQECLTNTARHAGARRAAVRLLRVTADGPDGGAVELSICDDGVGWSRAAASAGVSPAATSPVDPDAGHGLAGIRDRVELLGGTLTLSAGPGTPPRGACVTVRLPLQ